jgi:O-acetylhomoserine/O-acetylserine sulfhydrylase-like pyridoxal-dependent enzyme
MGSENFNDFLIPLKFTLDEPSKKKFDAAIGEVEKKFAAVAASAGAAATAFVLAVKEISKSLANLAYSAERVGASSEEFKALGNAAERIGIGAEAAKSSLTEFFAFVNF